jgi:hypothetical protein
VPLSEHEQRVLEQIERSLYAEDPKFRATVSKTSRKRMNVGSLRIAVALGVVGLAVLVGGVWLQNVLVGVLGFLVMLSAGIMGLRTSGATPAKGSGKASGSVKRGSAAKGGMADKAQDRLRRRFEGQ